NSKFFENIWMAPNGLDDGASSRQWTSGKGGLQAIALLHHDVQLQSYYWKMSAAYGDGSFEEV
ncbi:MAG: hypothetical protein AAF985_21380, partial [Bacteroidota bacterium]